MFSGSTVYTVFVKVHDFETNDEIFINFNHISSMKCGYSNCWTINAIGGVFYYVKESIYDVIAQAKESINADS